MITPKIHNIYNELTSTEQKIASYILSHPHSVVQMTAKRLADECDTAPSAVIRMCKSVGCDGFSELKILLANELGRYRVMSRADIEKGEDPEIIFRNVFNTGINTLSNTLEMIDFNVIREISQIIFNSDRTFIFGIGTSSVVAIDAAYRFSQLGIQAYSYTDILYMGVMAANMKKGDAALFVSHSGKTKAVLSAMNHAKGAGADIISITSYSKSVLARESDFYICAYADDENYPVEAVSARIAHMCIVDALFMTLAAMKKDTLPEQLSKRDKILREIKYL